MKTITTAVVLIKLETVPVMNINKGIIRRSGNIFNFWSPCESQEITPLSSKPMAIIIKHNIDIVAGLENPLIASSGLKSPRTNKLTIIKNAILSTGNTSKANKTTDDKRTVNTMIISIVIV